MVIIRTGKDPDKREARPLPGRASTISFAGSVESGNYRQKSGEKQVRPRLSLDDVTRRQERNALARLSPSVRIERKLYADRNRWDLERHRNGLHTASKLRKSDAEKALKRALAALKGGEV